MNTRRQWFRAAAIGFVTCFIACAPARAQEPQDKEKAELAKALKGVRVTLEQALSAAETTGTPISAKFEVEEGKLQLSVYTMKGHQFSEVIVDYTTGHVVKSDAISGGEDLMAAKAQAEAMAAAKQTLRATVERARKANSGSRAVSVVPNSKGGKAAADVTLLQGSRFKTVSEPLD